MCTILVTNKAFCVLRKYAQLKGWNRSLLQICQKIIKYESGREFLTFWCFSSRFTLNEMTCEDWDKLLMSFFAAMYLSGKRSDQQFSTYHIPCGFFTYFLLRRGCFAMWVGHICERLCLTDALLSAPQALPWAEWPSGCLWILPSAYLRPPCIWISPEVPSTSVWKFQRIWALDVLCAGQPELLTPRGLAAASCTSMGWVLGWEHSSSPVSVPAVTACLAVS